jgi:hypothetical protein
VIATLLLLPLTYFLVSRTSTEEPGREELTAFFGTWTDEQGEPGNSIRFWEDFHDLPGMPSFIQVGEGHVTFIKQFGADRAQATWNYENWRPLRLNIIVADKARIVPVRMLDQDHMLLRFLDPKDLSSRDDFDSPETLRLMRIREAERP